MPVPSRSRARDRGALDDRVVEALLSGRPVAVEPALTAALALLRVGDEQPVPSAALARMLTAGVLPLPAAAAPSRAVSWFVRGGVALGVVLTSLVGAAAAEALPAPLQRGVTGIVEALTSIDLDGESDAPTDPSAPTDPEVEPATGEPGLPAGTGQGVGADEREPDEDAGGGRDEVLDPVRSADEDADRDADEDPDRDAVDPDQDGADQGDADQGDAYQGDADRDEADVDDMDGTERDAPASDGPASDGPGAGASGFDEPDRDDPAGGDAEDAPDRDALDSDALDSDTLGGAGPDRVDDVPDGDEASSGAAERPGEGA